MVELAATGLQIALLEVLKHPLTRAGLPLDHLRAGTRVLEIAGLRQAWCGQGLDALARSLDLTHDAKLRHPAIDFFSESDWNAAGALLHRLKDALEPLRA